jgi:HTH-type transcriptional regulator, sugar sensing transcriptional regulator
MLADNLKKLGLDDKEAQLYLSLLELSEANIARISKKSGIKRTTCYDIIDSLREKGLISVSNKKNKIFFSAEDPRKLEQLLDEKRHLLKNILPELLSITNLIDKKPKVRFFEGIEGIKDVYRDTLNYPDQEIVGWATPETVKYFDVEWLWKVYVPKRLENKIWERIIAPKKPEIENLKSYDQKHLRQMRLVSQDNALFEVEINLYGNQNIAIMSFEERIGLIIESKKIYNTLKSIFEMNWNNFS